MNFNYSYRAFLITSLLFGILFLILFGIRLKGKQQEEEAAYDIEYALEELLSEEEKEESEENPELVEIETNRAFNEAEKFISKLEKERGENAEETLENKLNQIDEAIDNAAPYGDETAINKSKELLAKKESLTQNNDKEPDPTASNSSSRKTTISYRLVDRKAIQLPNPVYTCEGGGKIVLNIEVNELGRVIKAVYNKTRSTTTNGCLIDSAIDYANESRFTTKAGKEKQLGTISYNFPGQQ